MIKNVNSCAVAIASSTYNHNDSKSNPSLLRTPTIQRKFSRKRKIEVDKLVLFQAAHKMVDIDSISEQNSPENFTFKRLDNSVQLFNLKCALLGLRQFLATESSLKMMRNAFYFFVLKIFKFLSWLFGHVARRVDKEDKVNFKFYDVPAWLTNSRNTHIAQYFEK